ncbi:unnamed protein product [Urochloa humidicola]
MNDVLKQCKGNALNELHELWSDCSCLFLEPQEQLPMGGIFSCACAGKKQRSIEVSSLREL